MQLLFSKTLFHLIFFSHFIFGVWSDSAQRFFFVTQIQMVENGEKNQHWELMCVLVNFSHRQTLKISFEFIDSFFYTVFFSIIFNFHFHSRKNMNCKKIYLFIVFSLFRIDSLLFSFSTCCYFGFEMEIFSHSISTCNLYCVVESQAFVRSERLLLNFKITQKYPRILLAKEICIPFICCMSSVGHIYYLCLNENFMDFFQNILEISKTWVL